MHVIKNKCNFASVSKTNLFNSYYIQEKRKKLFYSLLLVLLYV